MQKISASYKRQDSRRGALTVAELENAVRVFSQLSAASNLHIHGFDEKKINTHVDYCKHLLEAAKVHREVAKREEQQQTRQRQELARQVALAEEARRKAEEQRKLQMEKRKQEDEARKLKQQEDHLTRLKEQWRSGSRRKERESDDEAGNSERRKKKGGGGKRRKKDKKSRYEMEEEPEADIMDDHVEETKEDGNNMNHRVEEEATNQFYDQDDNVEENPQDLLAATVLEDSDIEEEAVPTSAVGRRKRAWSESDEDEPTQRLSESSPIRENSDEPQGSDKEDADKHSANADYYRIARHYPSCAFLYMLDSGSNLFNKSQIKG